MKVYILTDADYLVLDRMSQGLLSSREASAFLDIALTGLGDWDDQRRCIVAAVEGGYADLAERAILAGSMGAEALLIARSVSGLNFVQKLRRPSPRSSVPAPPPRGRFLYKIKELLYT